MSDDTLRATVREILHEELQAELDDASWRIHQSWDDSQVPAEGLNLKRHQLTGYTVTSNSPGGGSIAWADLHVVYDGTDYGPYSGNTSDTFVWFDEDHVSAKIQTGNSKPTLAAKDALLFINDSGTAREVLKDQLVHGKIILDGTLDTAELADAAITASKILGGAVGTAALDDNAVTNAKIGPSAVNTTELASGAVTNGKIGSSAVNTGELATGAVTEAKVADDAITTAKLAAGAVDGTAVGAGVIDTTKLDIFAHMLY